MSGWNTLTLLVNGSATVLALVMLVLILWQDSRSRTNLTFAAFILMAVVWSVGTLLSRISAYVGGPNALTGLGIRLLEVGFTGACLGLYMFALTATGGQRRIITQIAATGAAFAFVYQIGLIMASGLPEFAIREDGTLVFTFNPLSALLYITFTGATLLLLAQRRRKLPSMALFWGLTGYGVGLLIELISPELRSRAVGVNLSALAALLSSYAVMRAQIIEPLSGRAAQLQAVRDVGLAITSSLRLEDVLDTIAGQAAQILKASGAAIYLNQQGSLELAAEYNMTPAFRGYTLPPGEGLVGKVAGLRQAIRLDDYRREWTGYPDVPYAKDGFGSVVAAPLVVDQDVMGVLLVAEGPAGKRFTRDDVQLLELIGPQAAVAISNSRRYETERTLAAELSVTSQRLDAVLASTDNPVIALNHRLEVIFANRAAGRLIPLPEGTPIRAANVLPPSGLRARRALRTGGAYTYELTLKERTYLCHVSLLGEPRGYVAVLNDISQLKELDRLKTQMIQMTSHQLKNPLFGAMSTMENLRADFGADLSEAVNADLETIWTELRRMERIITNILNLERVQTGTVALEEVAIGALLETTLRDFTSQAERKGLHLVNEIAPDLPVIQGDRHYLTQAFANLIENAVKFTPAEGQITVRATPTPDALIVAVADTGIGIPPEALSRVFERFFRVQQRAAEAGRGSGLGLSLVRAVVEAHHGRVWVESKVGAGTTFFVALPIPR